MSIFEVFLILTSAFFLYFTAPSSLRGVPDIARLAHRPLMRRYRFLGDPPTLVRLRPRECSLRAASVLLCLELERSTASARATIRARPEQASPFSVLQSRQADQPTSDWLSEPRV